MKLRLWYHKNAPNNSPIVIRLNRTPGTPTLFHQNLFVQKEKKINYLPMNFGPLTTFPLIM